MKQLLVDYIPFIPDRQMIAEAISQNRPITVVGVLQRAGVKNQNGRIYPKNILAREVNMYTNREIKENRALGELDHPDCARESLMCLTDDGWKYIKDISDTENIYTLNMNTNEIELQQITKKIVKKYDGTMFSIKGKNINTLVTPTHKFLIKSVHHGEKIVTIAEIYNNRKKYSKYCIPKTANWSGIDKDIFTIPACIYEQQLGKRIKKELLEKYSKDLEIDSKVWFGFIALYLAEGCLCDRNINKGGYSIQITQKNQKNIEKIRELLNKLPNEITWIERKRKLSNIVDFIITDARLWYYLKQFGLSYEKYIDKELKQWDSKYLQEFIDWYLLGDGSVIKSGKYITKYIATTSKKMAEDIQEILIKLGIASTIVEQEKRDRFMYERLIKKENTRQLYRVKILTTKNIWLDDRFLQIEKVENYNDNVYCIEVPNKIFMAKDQEKIFWTHNSTVVNLSNSSHIVREIWWKNDDVMGKIEILNTPSGNILKELLNAGIRLGISSRGLGSVKNVDENTVQVDEDFNLICFDFVSNPSTQGAFMNRINESVKLNSKIEKSKYYEINKIITDILTKKDEENI